MKVLHVVSRLQYGGIERYLLTLVRGLDASDFRCDVACVGWRTTPHDPLVAAFERAGARVWHVPMSARTPRQLARFRALATDGGYDVVHSHLADASGLIAALLAGSGIRCVASYHNANDYTDLSLRTRMLMLTSRQWLRLMHVPLSGCSDYAIVSHFGSRPPSFWRSVYYGIDAGRFRPATSAERALLRAQLHIADDRIVITHVGRFVPQKNHALVIATAEKLRARLPRALFVLVGSGPLRETVEDEIRTRSLQDVVRIASATDTPETLLRASDVFFMPSRFEGFGLALLEAYASGLPVVATDIPAFREFAAGWPAVHLVRPSPRALAAALVDASANLERARGLVREMLPEIRAVFSAEAAVERWKRLMREVSAIPPARLFQ